MNNTDIKNNLTHALTFLKAAALCCAPEHDMWRDTINASIRDMEWIVSRTQEPEDDQEDD